MISTKKAIMVSFLVTIIFSIILFGSAIIIASKFLRLTNQGSENFNQFTAKLEEVQKTGKENVPYGFMLILDEDTSVMMFNKGQNLNLKYPTTPLIIAPEEGFGKPIIVFGGADSGPLIIASGHNEYNQYNVFYSYPREQCKDQDCLVLCRSKTVIDTPLPDIERIDGNTGDKIITHVFNREYTCTNLIAEPIDTLKINSFGYFREKGDSTRRFPIRITKSLDNLVVSNE